MNIVRLSNENLEKEHICCAISSNKDPQVVSKKKWLSERIEEGLVFLKSDKRGKCFIEYIPAEYAWAPVDAEGYMYINCFWVSGQLKGNGYANELLAECISDSRNKGKKGLCVISSEKKRAFLSDPDYLAHKGFNVADVAQPHFTLMYLPFDTDTAVPKFKDAALRSLPGNNGFWLYYTSGCPFTAKYVPLIEEAAKANNIQFKSVFINNREAAQKAPAVWTNYALFFNGKYITNEILSVNKFLSLADKLSNGGNNGF